MAALGNKSLFGFNPYTRLFKMECVKFLTEQQKRDSSGGPEVETPGFQIPGRGTRICMLKPKINK